MSDWKNLADLVTFAAELLARIAVHLIVLLFWVLCQWTLGYIIKIAELSELDKWMVLTLQTAFAIATLLPIGFFIYVDLRKMVIRGKTVIQRYEAGSNEK